MQFHVEDMTCGGCARSVTKAIQTVDPKAVVQADPPTRQLSVESSASVEQITAALQAAGFSPQPL